VSRARDLKFGTPMQSDNISKTRKEKSRKGAWPRSRDPHKFWRTPERIFETSTARDLKFGVKAQSGNISKSRKEKS